MEAVDAPSRAWPPKVAHEIEARRARLLSRARTPLLDLDDPDARARLSSAEVAVADADRYATIVCTGALVDEPDLARAVRALAILLADDGELLMIEPVNRAGTWGLLVSSAGALLPAVAGLHLSRDVVAAVRAAGLTVADVDRFEVPTRVWPLQRFVQLRVVRIPRPALPIDDPAGALVSGLLALVGGGEWSEGCTFDEVLIERSGASEVAVLPTGSAYERPDHLVEQAQRWFATFPVDVRPVDVLTRRDAFDADLATTLREAKLIYLAGTSAMHLRSVLKDTPVLDAILAAWADGAALAGTNAGADVLCDPMVDSRGGAFTVGLGVVRSLAVIPQFDLWSPDKVRRTVELAPAGVSLAGVPRQTALLRLPDGSWTAQGAGRVAVYLDGHAANPEDLVA